MKSNNKKGFFNWGSDLKRDIPAALVVFLVALPLCLGIALASGAPPLSGIIAGIAGGIVVTFFSNSALGVSGPAAGLVTIVAGAITYFQGFAGEEGGFELFLVAVVLAGVIQVILGLVKLGNMVGFFPGAVINGMLAGIGLIITLKQIPHAFGYDKDYEGDIDFDQADGKNTFTEIFDMHDAITQSPTLVFIFGLLITLLWSRKFMQKQSFTKIISAPLMIVVLGAVFVAAVEGTSMAVSSSHLVTLPEISGLGDVFYMFPNFDALQDSKVYTAAITLAVVASLETLLCLDAADRLDPEMRRSNPNQELLAQGAGNLVSGFLGGLPVTQVIVRSSANAQNGAKSKLSAFLHGWLLLLSVLLIPSLMNYIPLASLAAVLIVIGMKLSKPSLYRDYWQRGWMQFVPFIATIGGILFSDLLTGIGIGFAIALLITIFLNEVKSFGHLIAMIRGGKLEKREDKHGRVEDVIVLSERISFISKAGLRSLVQKIDGDRVMIDFENVIHIDNDGQEVVGEIEYQLEQQGKHVHKHGGALIK